MVTSSPFDTPNGVLHCSMSPQGGFSRAQCARGGSEPSVTPGFFVWPML